MVALVLSVPLWAGTTSAVLSGISNTNFSTADSSCANLKTQFALVAGRVLLACSSDPVVVGTDLLYANTAINPRTVSLTTVVAQTSAAPTTAYPAAQQPEFQSASVTWGAAQISAAITAIPPSSVASAQVTIKDAFGTATPDQYAAMAALFGSVLCASAIIWGAKRILVLLRHETNET